MKRLRFTATEELTAYVAQDANFPGDQCQDDLEDWLADRLLAAYPLNFTRIVIPSTAGDMEMADYDQDADGKVDDSEKLDGQTPAQVRVHTPQAHTLDSHSEKKLDQLDEKTPGSGVTVDGCLVKDGRAADSGKLEGSTKAQVQNHTAPDSSKLEGSTKAQVQDHTPKAHTLDSHSEKKLDTLGEKTPDTGVTVDGCLIKDGKAADSNKLGGSSKAAVQTHAPAGHTHGEADITDLTHVAIASIAETNTGTSATKAVSPDALAGSVLGEKGVCIVPFESDADVATGDGKVAFTVPLSMNGMNLVDALASVHTQGITGTTDVLVRRRRAGSDAEMLSTEITIGAEYFASDGVIDGTKDDIATGDQLFVDVDAVHSGTAPKGLSVVLTFRKP